MATQRNWKRQNKYEPFQESSPTKIRKANRSSTHKHSATRLLRTTSEAYSEAQTDSISTRPLDSHSSESWHSPPEFWDGLSKVPLCQEALDELDRRNRLQPACSSPAQLPPTQLAQDTTTRVTTAKTRDFAQFARHGGPDLCHLRWYTNRATIQSTPKEREPMRATHLGFEQHLVDHGILSTWESQELNLEEERAALAKRRPSLTPSQFSEHEFSTFKKYIARAVDKADVLANVISTITGTGEANYLNARKMPFRNLDPLTDGAITAPKPDIYYGSISQQLNPTVRNELGHHIAPSAEFNRPIVPNFFLEVKGPDGTPAVMMRQIRHDGAVGARAIHSLQNYGEKEPVYDGKAYTYSSAYQNGHLQLYAHHTTAAPGGQPEYHTSELRDFAMRGSRENFLEGATAFRNARDLAKEHRDTFIRHANSKLQVGIAAAEETVHDEQDM